MQPADETRRTNCGLCREPGMSSERRRLACIWHAACRFMYADVSKELPCESTDEIQSRYQDDGENQAPTKNSQWEGRKQTKMEPRNSCLMPATMKRNKTKSKG